MRIVVIKYEWQGKMKNNSGNNQGNVSEFKKRSFSATLLMQFTVFDTER